MPRAGVCGSILLNVSMPSANQGVPKDPPVLSLPLSQGPPARLGWRLDNMNLEKTLEPKTKTILQSKPFIILCDYVGNEKRDQLYAVTSPHPHSSTHYFWIPPSERGNRDTHTIDVSINETQPLCLSYCTQMVNTTLVPPAKTIVRWGDESAKLLRVGEDGKENGMLWRDVFTFQKFVALKEHW